MSIKSSGTCPVTCAKSVGGARFPWSTRTPTSLWTPKVLAPAAWWRADLGVTLVSSVVSAWADQSGNGNTLSQSVAGSRPAYNASDANFNGQASIVGAAGDLLDGGDILDIPDGSDFCILAVTKSSTPSPSGNLINKASSTDGYVFLLAGDDLQMLVRGNNNSATASDAPTVADNDAKHVLMSEYDESAGLVTLYIEGSSVATDTTTALTGTTKASGTDFYVLNRGDGNREWDGELAELVILNRILTASEKASWHSYVNNRYGFSI